MPTDLEKIRFANTIIQIVRDKDLTYFEAVLYHCDEIGLELEVAATLVSPKLKELIAADAENLHMLAKTPKLPGV